MINAPFIINEDGLHRKKVNEQVYEGMPVSLDVNGEIVVAVSGMKVYGLSKLDSNQYRDFSIGEFAAYGSGQLTIVTRGTCEVSHSVYNQIEVDANTTVLSAPVTKKLFDDTRAYVPHEPLYIDGSGYISNDPALDHTALMGKVLLPLPIGSSGPLTIEIDTMATSVASELA